MSAKLPQEILTSGGSRVARPTLLQQMIRATIHMLQFAVAYFIMLLAMYYNGKLALFFSASCLLVQYAATGSPVLPTIRSRPLLTLIALTGYIIICIFIGAWIGAFAFSWDQLGAKTQADASEVTGCCG